MRLLEAGTELDGFVIGDCLHAGGMAHIYSVRYASPSAPDPGFAMVMKVPRMTAGDGAENIIGFEVEQLILRALSGPHVPRFVATGDLARMPWLVMEHLPGQTLQHWLDRDEPLSASEIAALGTATARAVHSLHQQDAVHLDLKPGNVMIRPDGAAVLLDFGLSWHAHYPDLLAEELRKAVGSPAWMAPEQVVGVRGDPRSDIFSIGVMLYQLATGRLPFGNPTTAGGLRQRLWTDPQPLRAHRPGLPEWLQEVVLRCLEPEAAKRYPSASQLAFDLCHPEAIPITDRGRRLVGTSGWTHVKRWFRAAGLHYQPSPLPTRQLEAAPIAMVAVPHWDVSDATLFSLRESAARVLAQRPGARLACVSVVSPDEASATDAERSETSVHRRHLARLRQWAEPLGLPAQSLSCHVIEASDTAQALIRYAVGNQVSILIMGAATHGLTLQRLVATVPIKVAMAAPCTVVLVKPNLPFEQLESLLPPLVYDPPF